VSIALPLDHHPMPNQCGQDPMCGPFVELAPCRQIYEPPAHLPTRAEGIEQQHNTLDSLRSLAFTFGHCYRASLPFGQMTNEFARDVSYFWIGAVMTELDVRHAVGDVFRTSRGMLDKGGPRVEACSNAVRQTP
jgi:hypothetical protein